MTDDGLTQAELFDVFSNARRRRTVRYLERQGGECKLAPLVEQVAAWENDTVLEQVTRSQRRRVYISLYQTHLPMLADHGIIDWDADGHRIELLPDGETFEPYLDRHVEVRIAWHRLYAALVLVGATVFALSWLSVGPLSIGVAPLVVLVLGVAIFVVAAVQNVTRRSRSRYASWAPFSRR